MSYILDALKKAEAERHMGKVPNVLAQPAIALLSAPGASNRKTLFIIAALLLAAICAALVWFKPWQGRTLALPPEKSSSSPAAENSPQMALEIAPDTTLAAPVAMAPSATSIVTVSPAAENPEKPHSPLPKPRKPPSPTPKEKPVAEPILPTEAALLNTPDIGHQSLKMSKVLTPELPAVTLQELPAQIQRELPPLTIGGYIYSEHQRERQLLVNMRLLHEGEEAAPGVILEQMQPKTAVFSYKGYRYRIDYQ